LQLPFTDFSLFLAENSGLRSLWIYREKSVISLI